MLVLLLLRVLLEERVQGERIELSSGQGRRARSAWQRPPVTSRSSLLHIVTPRRNLDCSPRPDLQPFSCPTPPPPSTHAFISRPLKATSLSRPLLKPSCNPAPKVSSTAALIPPAASPDFKLATQGTTLRSSLSLPQPPSSRLRTLLSAPSSWSVSPAAWSYRQGRADRAFFHTLSLPPRSVVKPENAESTSTRRHTRPRSERRTTASRRSRMRWRAERLSRPSSGRRHGRSERTSSTTRRRPVSLSLSLPCLGAWSR